MSVKVRLARAGAKKRPYYKVVVCDSRTPRDGRFIERIGSYDPTQAPAAFKIDSLRLDHWLKVGAEPSETVQKLIKKHQAGAQPTA